MRVGIDQIDIGTEIQLAATELAQCEHHQTDRPTLLIADRTETLREGGFKRFERKPQAGIGQTRGAGERVVQRIHALHIAPDQTSRFGIAIATQQGRPIALGLRRQFRQRQCLSAVIGAEPREQPRLPQQGIDRQVADDRYRRAGGAAASALGRCLVQRTRVFGRGRAQTRERALGDGLAARVVDQSGHGAIVAFRVERVAMNRSCRHESIMSPCGFFGL
jgi:hypothetical protein